jgi:hypothetical protein
MTVHDRQENGKIGKMEKREKLSKEKKFTIRNFLHSETNFVQPRGCSRAAAAVAKSFGSTLAWPPSLLEPAEVAAAAVACWVATSRLGDV